MAFYIDQHPHKCDNFSEIPSCCVRLLRARQRGGMPPMIDTRTWPSRDSLRPFLRFVPQCRTRRSCALPFARSRFHLFVSYSKFAARFEAAADVVSDLLCAGCDLVRLLPLRARPAYLSGPKAGVQVVVACYEAHDRRVVAFEGPLNDRSRLPSTQAQRAELAAEMFPRVRQMSFYGRRAPNMSLDLGKVRSECRDTRA